MYDPETSRFLQEDTYTGDKKDPLSLNLYTYCHNNPLIYDDPTGHFPHILLGGLVGGVLSVAATGITNLVTTGKLGSAKQYVGAFASGFVEGAVGAATLGIGSIAAKVAIDAATSFGSNLIEQKITTGKVSLKKAAVETATGMAISGAASKVAKKFQNSKINQKLTKKLDDVTSSLKSKTKNITANIAKKTKEATQKAVNTVSDKAKTIANKTLNGTSTSKSVKNKVASAIDSLGEGILSVQNTFAPSYEFAEIGSIKSIKTGFGESEEETLSQFLSKDVKKLKTMFFIQGSEGVSNPELNRLEYLRNKYGKLNSEQINNRINLRGAVNDELDRLYKSGISKNELGPAVAGVLDTKTGKYYFGINNIKGEVPTEIHPIIKERIDNMPLEIYNSYAKKTFGAGSHAEVYALNEAMLANPNAKLEDFMVYVVRSGKKLKPRGLPMPRCPHCEYITDGASYFPEVLKYGK